jgi:electron transfer flavoprotein beta subunit
MKAKKKPLDEINIADLGVAVQSKVRVVKMSPPASRKAGKKVASVQELVDLLANEAKVI